jgi:Sec-independent protein translocase protein TatA
MEFGSADRTRDAEYIHAVKDFNSQVHAYNNQLTKEALTQKEETENLKEEAGGEANTNAIKEAGQHANSVAQGLKTATDIQKLGQPIKATEDIVKVGEGGARQVIKKGEVIGRETAQTLGKSAGKLATGIGVIGDIGSIGLDISEDINNWGKMSTADKISNIADIGGAGLDMIGTGLMAFGGPIGAMVGLGLKGIGDIAQVGSGVEDTISGYQSAQDTKKDLDQQQEQAEKDAPDPKQEQKAGPTLAGAGTLAVGRQVQQ